jgi:hypothetical protein
MYPGISLSTLSTHLKYFSCILSPPLVPFIPRFLLRTSARSLPALEQHHSPPKLTSPLSLSYSPNTSNYLDRFPHYLSHLRIVRGALLEGVAQAPELAHSLYLDSLPLPLALLILPLSLVEHHHFRLLNNHFQLFLPHILFQVPHHFFHLSLTLCHQSPCRPQTPGSKQ